MSNETDKEVAAAVIAALLKERVMHLEQELVNTRIELEREITENTNEISKLKADRDAALKWGIMLLGTAVLSMGTWIFNLFSDKIKL